MKKEDILIQTDHVQVRIIELQAGDSTPFHHHSEITDNMFGISGEITVEMKNPAEKIILQPGTHCQVEPGRKHQVRNNLTTSTSKYLLVQGVGKYDFVKETP